ncbi:MAG: hypothetical protein AAFX93_05325 [Verrucomicrobiota bacterium]
MSKKIAYVHALPIEIFPPATNTIRLLGEHPDFELSVWSSANTNDLQEFDCLGAAIHRPKYPTSERRFKRAKLYLSWHWQCALALRRFAPDAIISVEPHSAYAVWIYYYLLGGNARLFIHHHEYNSQAEYDKPGMALLKYGHALESRLLFKRAEWISQTNDNRLRLLREETPELPEEKFDIWPNYPPANWLSHAKPKLPGDKIRLVYVGSASFEDTFIREITEWAAEHEKQVSLTIGGYNVRPDVWEWLETKNFPNVELKKAGWKYDELPRILGQFDVGLILYRGNTPNFVYNAPNKLFEYWACGLEVWYPSVMKQISELSDQQSCPALKKIDFQQLKGVSPSLTNNIPTSPDTIARFTAEAALEPLIARLS